MRGREKNLFSYSCFAVGERHYDYRPSDRSFLSRKTPRTQLRARRFHLTIEVSIAFFLVPFDAVDIFAIP